MYIISTTVLLNNAAPLYVSKTNALPIAIRLAIPCIISGKLNRVLTTLTPSTSLESEVYPLSTGKAMNRNSNTWKQNANRKPTNRTVISVYPSRRARWGYVAGENLLAIIFLSFLS